MITIVGDNFEELALMQDIIDSGIINITTNSSKDDIDVTYKLSSGNILLVNKYNHIVGEKKSESVRWEIANVDRIEIPNDPLNIKFSPEEIKNMEALFDVTADDIKNKFLNSEE